MSGVCWDFNVLEDILFMRCRFMAEEYDTCVIYGICSLVYFLNLKNFMFIHTMSCMCLTCLRRHEWAVVVFVSGWSWLMLRSSVFAHLKMSVESLKSQGKVRKINYLTPVATLTGKYSEISGIKASYPEVLSVYFDGWGISYL